MNLSSLLVDSGDLVQSESLLLEASRLAQRRGYVAGMRLTEGNMIELDLMRGGGTLPNAVHTSSSRRPSTKATTWTTSHSCR